MSSSNGFNSSFFSSNQDENMYISFSDPYKWNTRFVLDHHGAFAGNDWPQWDASLTNWYKFWSSQINICDTYGMCGPFGSCNPSNSPICSCLIGFRPKFPDEWSNGNWSGGCVRITQLECQNTSLGNSNTDDGFIKLESMKVPDYAILLVIEMEDCGKICLIKCSCLAYSYASGIGCMTWGENLVDIQNFTLGGEDLYIRLAGSDIDLALKNSTDPARNNNTDISPKRNRSHGLTKNARQVIVIMAALVGAVLAISICSYLL
ncbi:hypothetical protein MKW92_025851 [Papaver armeniacum]|nr:hypothetical protein MKW92_025851 [Papaver armeniacum]